MSMMSSRFLLFLFLFFPFSARAHIDAFINDDGESMILTKDSVFIRLNNHDAFMSYSVYYGAYYSSKPYSAKSRRIQLCENVFLSASFSVSSYQDSVVRNIFLIEDGEGRPLDYAVVSFYNNDNDLLLRDYSDANGIVTGLDRLPPQSLNVSINSLGLQWRGKIHLDHTADYLCRCMIPYSFIPLRKGTIILVKKQNRCVIITYNGRKIKMARQSARVPYVNSSLGGTL